MNIMYERCAGVDVHKKTVVVCVITPDKQGQRQKEQRTFSTMMPDLVRMRQWFQSLGVTHVAMESTGSFWKPIFNILELIVRSFFWRKNRVHSPLCGQNGC